MDLRKIKIGDEAYSCLRGWGEVKDITEYGFFVAFKYVRSTFRSDGRYYSTDINPEITDWKPKKREEWKPQLHLVKSHGMKSIQACKTFAAYVAEFAPDWKADWNDGNQQKWSIDYYHNKNKWGTYYKTIIENKEKIYMPEETAYRLCEDLNNKVVTL